MNQLPIHTKRLRLACIGEGPSEEDRQGPFSSGTGQLVSRTLGQLGIPINEVFLGYASTKKVFGQYQTLGDEAVIQGTEQLRQDLKVFRPNCCLLLGDLANRVFGSEHTAHTSRGTIFISPTFRYKCVTTLDPWMVMKNYSNSVPYKYDFLRAKEQALFPDHRPRNRTLEATPPFDRLVSLLDDICTRKPPIAFDLEGYPNQTGITCYSISDSPDRSFIVPFRNMDNSPYWSLDEETLLWQYTIRILSDPDIEKTAHNAMYELFVFAWRHKILVRGLREDTMFKMWELFSELPKSLQFVSSVMTEEPYYKDERKVPDLYTHHEYCCKDSLVTGQASAEMDKMLSVNQRSREHYQFNIRLLKPYLYMQLRGCKLDIPRIAEMRAKVWEYIRTQQEVVNQMAGKVLNTKSPKQMPEYLYQTLHLPPQYKNVQGKKVITSDFGALCSLYTSSELPVLLEIVKLTKARTRFSDLNKLQAFPDGRIRCNYNPVGTETGRLSSSETWVEAIVRRNKIDFAKRTKNKVAYHELVLKPISEVSNLGTNLQNVTSDLREAFIPDNTDYDFYEYDLSGADAWTVAADLAALGNDKMLVHLQHKIKPSIVIVLLLEHGNKVYQWDIPTLQAYHQDMLRQVKTIPKLIRSYTGAKACQHGTNYGMQPKLMAALQLERSVTGWAENCIAGVIEPPDFKVFHWTVMEKLQNLYVSYYGLELRNDYLRRQLCNHGYLDAASGQRRYFLDIRNRKQIDDATIRVAASHEPQANTTYATNAAIATMYYDRENRTPRGNLRCEPLLMTHDAAGGQAHRSQRPWAEAKIAEWFDTVLTIHGMEIAIPVEGGWGRNWLDVK